MLAPGCGDGRESSTDGQPAYRDSIARESVAADPDTLWTAGIVERDADDGVALAVITATRTARHEGFSRFTIELTGTSLPGYHIEYIDRPLRECGSGRQIQPVGDAWLEIRLDGAAAHTESGQPTLPGRQMEAEAPPIYRIYRTCDFEGVVTSSPTAVRADPTMCRVLPDCV